jgi:aminobenzoyl-glutamate utilization protein B
MVSDTDTPATYLNKEIMETYKPKLAPFYYNEKKYNSYLEQLGITYPTLKADETASDEK